MLELQNGNQANILEAIDNYREEKWLRDDDLIRAWSRVLKKIFKVSEDTDLSNLHNHIGLLERANGWTEKPSARFHRFNVGGRTLFAKRYHDALNTKSQDVDDFKVVYEDFLRKHCAPNVGLAAGCGHTLLYQRNPTLRVMYPNIGKCVGKMHKDADYHHQEGEINFWVPLVDLAKDESACLYAESSPKKGDFHPFNCSLGQFVRFWGNQATHYTVENVSSITRVSLDFRVIRLCDFDMNPTGRGSKNFRRNEYYSEIVI